jgi:hypothetical protein
LHHFGDPVSRSRKKTPIGGITTAESEKRHKRLSHKNFRAKQRQALLSGNPAELPVKMRDAVNPWSGDKDGKSYFGNMKDDKYKKKLLRK